jgi:hypothetical protein
MARRYLAFRILSGEIGKILAAPSMRMLYRAFDAFFMPKRFTAGRRTSRDPPSQASYPPRLLIRRIIVESLLNPYRIIVAYGFGESPSNPVVSL